MMKETGIIMSGDHPRLVLYGLKTQTRRVIKPQPELFEHGWNEGDEFAEIKCPYGQVGGRLWIRETWATEKRLDRFSPSYIGKASVVPIFYKATDNGGGFLEIGKWRPSIFMPKWATRIRPEITGLRAERVQEITHDDCLEEGISPVIPDWHFKTLADYVDYVKKQFAILWDTLNAKRGYGFDFNPWVWVISFKEVN